MNVILPGPASRSPLDADKDQSHNQEHSERNRASPLRHGWSEARLDTLAATITYHLNVRVTLDDGVEAYLFNTGVALDVVGSRARELTPAQRDAVLARHPRTGFRDAFLARYRETAAAAPACRAAFHVRWLRFGRLVQR